MEISYSSEKHIPTLDGIRGLAIILVLIFHLFGFFPPAKLGWMGVDLFFVLSGFLISGILINTKSNPRYFQNFFARRVLRIFPLYYMVLIIFMLIYPLMELTDSIRDYQYLNNNQGYFWLYMQNWLASFDANWPKSNALSHFWSLAVEEQYYLFWPFLIYYIPTKHIKWLCLGAILFAFLVRNFFIYMDYSWVASYVNTFARLDSLAVGSLLAYLIRFQKDYLERYTVWVMVLSGVIILALVGISRSAGFSNPLIQGFGFTLIAVFFGTLICVSLVQGSIPNKLFSHPWMIFFGKYSYGLYVYHTIILRLYVDPIKNLIEGLLGTRNLIVDLLTSIIILTLSIVISYISYNLVEKKFTSLKKHFTVSKSKFTTQES